MGNKITRRRPVIDERYTRPQGLYPCRDVDHRKLRRLILESKLAPCYPGAEEPATDLEECPICFLQYPSLNRSKCCTKGVCTECFLQMKSPHATRQTQCPFCKTPNYAVEYRGAKTVEEKGMEQAEEQKVIEAKIRIRQQEVKDDEEREKRREEDIRLGRVKVQTPRVQPNSNHPTSITPLDETEGLNWRSGWGNADRQEQRTGGLGITGHPFQQSAVSVASNIMPAVTQQQTEIDFHAPRFPPGAPRSRHRQDGFDLDLEDIMVMEAIWLSIQEQGARHRFADVEATRPSEPLIEISLGSEADMDPATGGLAGAIAALAERRATIGGNTAPASHSPILSPEVDHRAGEISEGTGNQPGSQLHSPEETSQRAEENSSTERLASETLAHWVSSTQEDYTLGSSKSVGGQSSQRAEIGTSFASSVPSSSELTWESPENSPPDARNGETNADDEKVLLPDSFEERMMLAMALSIADASRLHQGDTRSGPLPQPTH